MNPRHLTLCAAAFVGACSSTPPPRLTLAAMPPIDTSAMLADIRRLSSDEFGGRAPGSKGEALTVAYLIDRFKAAGAEPGNPDGTWVQNCLLYTSPSPR